MSGQNVDSKILELRNQLEQKRKLIGKVNLNLLPDRGAKITNQIDDLENKLKILSIHKETIQNENVAQLKKSDFHSLHEGNTKNMYDSPVVKSTSNEKKLTTLIKTNLASSGKGDCYSVAKSSNVTSKSFNSEEMLSFRELNTKNFHYVQTDCYSSPSFKNYRDSKPKTTQLIEAISLPPHLLPNNKDKNLRTVKGLGFQNDTVLSSAKNKAVHSIYKSLNSRPSEDEEEDDPPGLKTKMLKHQRQALSWLIWRECEEPSGGIYADDMGLGKTLTMISLILKQSKDKKDASIGGTLVVCVPCVLHQWKSEILKHCNEAALSVLIYHDKNRHKIQGIKTYDVVLTTYNVVLADGKALKTKSQDSDLFGIHWQRIILDEAHTIRNPKTQTAEWIFKLAADSRWAVTGTPIHNNLKDMYCLLKFLRCSPFDDHDTWKKLIKQETKHSKERRDALVKSIMYRKDKTHKDKSGVPLIKLPSKKVITYQLVLNEREKSLYDRIFQQSREKLKEIRQSSRSFNNSLLSKNGASYLTFLLRLQQCCSHPSLLKSPIEDDTCSESSDSLSELLCDFVSLNIDKKPQSLSEGPDLDLSLCNTSFTAEESSTKIDKLLCELYKISRDSEGKEKSVVVSQWITMLAIVSSHLEQNGVEYLMIQGNTKPEQRNIIAEDVNSNPNGPKILLLSLKAGGVGLNLVGANHLFLLDLHWNPALEEQACDRVHRVGQTLDVCIHKFVCKDTIEEKILHLQKDKSYLAESILNNAKTSKTIAFQDLKELFNV